jgi:hypothetical protein
VQLTRPVPAAPASTTSRTSTSTSRATPWSSAARRSSVRSSVGSVTTLSSQVRTRYARAGTYPRGQAALHAEGVVASGPPRALCDVAASRTAPYLRRHFA